MTRRTAVRTWRIGWALMVGIGAAVMVAGLSSGWFVYSLAKNALIREGMQEIVVVGTTSAQKLTQEYRRHPVRAPVEDLTDLAAAGHLYVLLQSSDGRFIGSSGPLPPVLPQLGWIHTGPSGWLEWQGVPYVFSVTALSRGDRDRQLIIVHGLDRTALLLSTLRTALLLGEILLMGISILAVALVVRQVTDPLRSLEAVAETVTFQGKHQERVVLQSNLSEVVSLTHSFNRMLDRLLSAQERERQFISNAAHSLRTPIHVIRGYVHTLNQWGRDDPENRHQALKALARESLAMETLVNRLLQLSQVEQGDPPALQRLAVLPYLRGILPNLRDTCLHHPLTLDVHSQDVPDILSEPDLLEAVLRTLVENADTYADPDTPVALTVDWLAGGRRVRIGVVNQGPEIPPGDVERLFDRFYRARQADSSGHYGLGLAIANSIVARIQGAWVIESHHGRTTFAIDLPAVWRK